MADFRTLDVRVLARMFARAHTHTHTHTLVCAHVCAGESGTLLHKTSNSVTMFSVGDLKRISHAELSMHDFNCMSLTNFMCLAKVVG